jgi:hypothetical protein
MSRPLGEMGDRLVGRHETGYGLTVAAKNESAPKSTSSRSRSETDRTPVSSSGVVVRSGSQGSRPGFSARAGSRRRDSEPPALTPYQARLDVEMDDTAVSKVRDPSVSISLDADSLLPIPSPPSTPPRFQPVYSVVLGTVLGALIVMLLVLLARALSR